MGDQEKKTKEARLRRLKERLAYVSDPVDLVPILKGLLDLLEDEL